MHSHTPAALGMRSPIHIAHCCCLADLEGLFVWWLFSSFNENEINRETPRPNDQHRQEIHCAKYLYVPDYFSSSIYSVAYTFDFIHHHATGFIPTHTHQERSRRREVKCIGIPCLPACLWDPRTHGQTLKEILAKGWGGGCGLLGTARPCTLHTTTWEGTCG